MSGTSLDGLDIALCRLEGHGKHTKLRIENFVTLPFESDYQSIVKPLFANANAKLKDVCSANAWVARKHAAMINQVLANWDLSSSDIDIVASHGQTIYHRPSHMLDDLQKGHLPNATLQIGDGDHIAQLTGIITLSDFRQKHVAAGGEGAPMVKYGDYLLFTDPDEYRVLINLGGIANVSMIPPNASFSDIISTDTGTANTYLDAMVQHHLSGQHYDANGDIAASGKVHESLLTALMHHPFLNLPAPKTTGQESFSIEWLSAQMRMTETQALPLPDLLATLVEFSAITLCDVIKKLAPLHQALALYASGGGANNPFLLSRIQAHLPQATLAPMQELGVSADAKEAALFALLANECICGTSDTFKNSKDAPNVSMGKISLPN